MGFRYIGSKEKLANSIIDIILQEVPTAKSFIDMMAGTGNFSLALRRRGYCVTASDVMTYSLHHLRVALLLNKYPSFNGLVDSVPDLITDSDSNYQTVLKFLNGLKGEYGYFSNEFSPQGNPYDASRPRMYYTSENAAKIDALRRQIKEWHEGNLISEIEHSLLLHTLILDSNDIANIAGTYGHYLSHFVKRSLSPLILKPCEIERNINTSHVIYRGYAEDIAHKCKGDVCYIDPPYIKRQYAANYHILETLAREDYPLATGESGLRPWRDQYSNFCSKLKIRSSFSKIIENIDSPNIFVSYSEDGLLPLNELLSFLSQYGQLKTFTIDYKRFKSNRSIKDPMLTEYLIYLKK